VTRIISIVSLVLIGAISGGGISWAGDESESGLPVHRDIESPLNIVNFVPVTPVLTLSEQEITVKVGKAGGIQIDTAGDSYVVESCFSYSGDGRKIGWNGLPRKFNQPRYPDVTTQKGNESSWKPKVKQISADMFRIEAEGECYRLQRTVKMGNGKVDFEDKLTNLRKVPTGVVIRHGVTASSDFRERFSVGLESPANPTVFLRGSQSSLGLVMQDNVSRRRYRPARGSSLNHSGVQINRCILDKGKSYTFSWSVYVMKEEQGYFDFINRVRRDWNANFEIQGPWTFVYLKDDPDLTFHLEASRQRFNVTSVMKDPERLRNYLKWRGSKILNVVPWLDFDPGVMDHVPSREEYKQLMRRFIPAIRKVDPKIRIIGSLETPYKTIYRGKIKDGHKLPRPDPNNRTTRLVSNEFTPEHVRIIEEGLAEWKDSFIRTSEGKLFMELKYRGGKPIEDPAIQVYPEIGNRQYDFMVEQVKLLVEEVGVDGVYFDMFAVSGLRTYLEKWDGMSGEIDFYTGEIEGEYIDCNLAGIEARVNLVNYLLSRGKIVIANYYCTSREEQSLPVNRFAETGWGLAEMDWEDGTKPPAINRMFFGHLNSPIGLGIHPGPPGEDIAKRFMKGLVAHLRHGLVYYHYLYPDPRMTEENRDVFGVVKHMFPITPIDLGEGFIVGKERILTAISMDRLWKKQDKPIVLFFDMNGQAVDASGRYEIKPESGQWRVIVKLRDWSEIAVVK